MKKIYSDYCTGCGLCVSQKFTNFVYDESGFPVPEKVNPEMTAFCDEVCPMGFNGLSKLFRDNIWGNYKEYYTGFAIDKDIRKHASTGGILTAISIWLITQGYVDAIIQTKYDYDNPAKTQVIVNSSPEEVYSCAGSRYSISSPLINIEELIKPEKKYVFIGKPCDVIALKNFSKMNKVVKECIVYYFSFFCAGTPSETANRNLLERLGCKKCKKLVYRGDGWPGLVKATDNTGKEYSMLYQDAWMNILGKVIRKSCKFCIDSIGEMSDISCGDYWKLSENKEPLFLETDGVNCIFAWTEQGAALLKSMHKFNQISLKKEDISLLQYVQPNHFYRRTTAFYRILAMKLMLGKVPRYSYNVALKYSGYGSIYKGLQAFKGTIKRIMKGSI